MVVVLTVNLARFPHGRPRCDTCQSPVPQALVLHSAIWEFPGYLCTTQILGNPSGKFSGIIFGERGFIYILAMILTVALNLLMLVIPLTFEPMHVIVQVLG
jgi:hypothetical protein